MQIVIRKYDKYGIEITMPGKKEDRINREEIKATQLQIK